MAAVLQGHDMRPKATTVVGTAVNSDFLVEVTVAGKKTIDTATLVCPGGVGTNGRVDDGAWRDGGVWAMSAKLEE